ncbi:hypothetical protein NQZ68_015998 [Dissostichus eleginoides]|nr:hypothetical protein NQZ68_015998 [Dissostichus eleginoides]
MKDYGQFPDAKNGSSNRPERAVWACPQRRATAMSEAHREPKTHREQNSSTGHGQRRSHRADKGGNENRKYPAVT